MAASPGWVPDRRDIIWIGFSPRVGQEMRDEHAMLELSTKAVNQRTGIVIGLPMKHAAANETNPFALKHLGPKGKVGYVLTHPPQSFDWRARGARRHPWKQLPALLFGKACDGLHSIVNIG